MNDISYDAYMHEESRRRLRETLRDLLRAWEIPFTYREHPDSCYDFYLPGFSLYIITGLTADDVRTDLRPELLSLPAASTATVLLERLDDLRRCHSKGEASRLIGGWARFSGHAAEVAQDLGLTS